MALSPFSNNHMLLSPRRHDTFAGSKTNGLHRFVLSAHYWSRIMACTSDIMAVVKRHHTSLSVLYLRFDREVIDSRFLFRLAHYRLPQLLELHLSAEGFSFNDDLKHTRMDGLRPSFNKAIAALLPRCPNLRILHIVEQLYCKPSLPAGLFSLEDNVILSLVDHCRFLDQLKIDTRERYIVQDNLTAIDFEEFNKIITKQT
ncbi:hypothetical protein O0I10_011343 [Lichtheimia ornata]|uniref:Uncharacterized protein n=1 Tax=Lichtheimia ornata TaxID=688661 RepID=A0AAD7UT44_9FUNG|nr:uncharacterized protein O0I10_011343 [Lichtheimia ornata]KAJ8653043.1 hypothetical protein O0I10_011343 [Lichtheimia ornata]